MSPTGTVCVSYWEWFKLIATAFLISCATTGMGFALWWVAVHARASP
jgi:hypothetical protein